MITTTVRIDTRHRDADRALRDVQALHGLVLRAALLGEPKRRVLWAHPEPDILIIRHTRPITPQDFPDRWVRDVHHTPLEHPKAGDRVALAWVANPARNHHAGTYVKRRTTAVPAAELREWAATRVGRGLDVESMTLQTLPTVRGIHADGNHPTVARVVVRAVGTVNDAPLVHQWLTTGLGRALAYGCGLVVTRPEPAQEAAA